jgi:drug/metabolite transporter (DMT)-like permease
VVLLEDFADPEEHDAEHRTVKHARRRSVKAVAVIFALLAATAFATGTVLQQRGTLSTPAGGDDARFLVQILRQPIWLAGAGLQALGWVLQAAALDRGPLVVVQALTTLSLVIALPIGVRLTDQPVGRREIAAAFAVVVGIVVFLSVGRPAGGTTSPTAAEWWAAGVLAVALVALIGRVGLHRHGASRAALFGAAAGVGYALQAAVTKVFVGELGEGVAHLLATWSTYVLIISAVLGFVLQQSALKTAALAPAMAASNASTLIFSAVFGIVVFDERLVRGSGSVVLALTGLGVAVVGVVRLAASGTSPTQQRRPSGSSTRGRVRD